MWGSERTEIAENTIQNATQGDESKKSVKG